MKNDTRLYVDVHVLQTVPPSCVNRDDTGSLKTAKYGGVTRARVSSQSWKRAMRLAFRELFEKEQLGIRTIKVVALVENEILRLAPDTADAEKMATNVLSAAGLTIKDKKQGNKKGKKKEEIEEGIKEEKVTGALFFISVAQVRALARLAIEERTLIEAGGSEAKAVATAALYDNPGIDIALFGRMVTDAKSLNIDACSQVAHSISTHKVNNEYNYLTAVDDMSPEDNAGAAYVGTVEFNSATLYRYATVAVHALEEHLGAQTQDAVKKFIYAFVRSMPDGKQNTFANRTLPDAVLVTIRNDQSVNLVGAFERPVLAGNEGYVAQSAQRLVDYAKTVYADYACEPEVSLVTGAALSALGEPREFTALLDTLGEEIELRIKKDGAAE